jgi:hypothetical protein
MYIRRAFTVFLDGQSEAQPRAIAIPDWTLDWRWFEESPPQAISPPAIRPAVQQAIIRDE